MAEESSFDFAKVEKDMGYLTKFLANLRAQADHLDAAPAAALRALLDAQDKSWPAILQCLKGEVPSGVVDDAPSDDVRVDVPAPEDAGGEAHEVAPTEADDATDTDAPEADAPEADAPEATDTTVVEPPPANAFTVGPLRHK